MAVGSTTTARQGPIASARMLAGSVVFRLRLRGTFAPALCPLRGVGVERSQRGVRAHLVHKHEPPAVDRGDHRLPSCSPSLAPTDLFSGVGQALDCLAYGGLANPHTQ